MTDWTLTKVKLQNGTWQGVVTQAPEMPLIAVTHLGRTVEDVDVVQGQTEDTWIVKFQIPQSAVADGVQTLLIKNASSDTVMDRVTLIAGEALGEDLRAEVDLLRAELDMLKRAFRRHCLETA